MRKWRRMDGSKQSITTITLSMSDKKDELECCVTTCGLPLNANYWDTQYQNNETAWDIGYASPAITQYIDSLKNKDLQILIPGCGNAYEAEYLLNKGFTNITLIDISSTLVDTLKEKYKDQKAIRIIHQDFFEHSEKYDLILEQTFFCALDPSLRQRYAYQCFHLLNHGGKIAGLLFNTAFEKAGPPFGGSKDEYQTLFGSVFNIKQMDVCLNSIKPREGRELFIELIKKQIPKDCVKLYKIEGITCVGCKNTITEQLQKIEGVKFVSVNTDFTNILLVSYHPIEIKILQSALAYDTKYKLSL